MISMAVILVTIHRHGAMAIRSAPRRPYPAASGINRSAARGLAHASYHLPSSTGGASGMAAETSTITARPITSRSVHRNALRKYDHPARSIVGLILMAACCELLLTG
ncbi:hypothetical protein CDD80_55 [Ophiocordyceps camponoti-rufipedis]|uniref:Uncharacterized protein n=1 Tax=Ophiocordyceps camponoti-rufipedis TaxID=2004952 RepID=A0A2C5XZX1_9HYPO|nr:hypothetical protein CDD80_55 [Ophiocordyceps camponoti-rufipedis]